MSNNIPKNFDHQASEQHWYEHWVNAGYFQSTPDNREPYAVVIPPPNVTGILHMGHCLNNTIQDVLVRRARLQGKNACWVPGTDHASIATEAKVVHMLRERGIAKSSLGREEFLQYAWEWKEKYGGIILQQLKKLGCSLDWNRVNFTMEPDYYQSVIGVFVDLYNKGLIYRGKRMINWDPKAKTALSDEEVMMRETQSKLYYLRYAVANAAGQPTDEYVTIATVRPETILGDTAVAAHPHDERYAHLKGKKVLVPLINRAIPVIFDEYVEKDFGTGALKVTPAHDKNDDMLCQKHGLEVVDIMNDDGTFSEAAQLFVGEDRFVVRKKIVPLLEEQGHLVKVEDYKNQVGYSERSDAAVEPRLSMQWWVKMQPLADPALKVVMDGDIQFHPAKFKNLYQHWMENIKDWCISRQLWWGHRIPAWYDAEGNVYVAKNEEEAYQQYLDKKGVPADDPLRTSLPPSGEAGWGYQDPDCLDTWFSSWLWPFEVFKGYSKPGNTDVRYYYPTATLVTAPEIIFFWVARMIMAGLEYEKQIPFRNVYFTGIVRDEKGRKMSKSLGNSPDLLELIDKYGADAVRFGILISSPAGNDLLFDVKEESTLKQGSFFVNKMWNALKLIKLWSERGIVMYEPISKEAWEKHNWPNMWFGARLQQAHAEIAQLMEQFRLSEALKAIYSLIWDDYCSWYLEWIKPAPGELISNDHWSFAISYYEQLMQLLHPFLPFVTEVIYHNLKDRAIGDDLTIRQLKAEETSGNVLFQRKDSKSLLAEGDMLKEVITAIRDARNKNQVKPREEVQLFAQPANSELFQDIAPILARQVNASISITGAVIAGSTVIAVEQDKFYLVAPQAIDTEAQKAELLKDLEYQRKFLESVERKLANERFVENAKPEVVDAERKKKADAEARIRTIEESLAGLG
jgi:valyl-tRNA synthetase